MDGTFEKLRVIGVKQTISVLPGFQKEQRTLLVRRGFRLAVCRTLAARQILESDEDETFAASFFSGVLDEDASPLLLDEALSDLEDEEPSPLLPEDEPSLLPVESPSPLFLAVPLPPTLPRPWSVV